MEQIIFLSWAGGSRKQSFHNKAAGIGRNKHLYAYGVPTRLVIPVTNFTATFYKIGYIGIKRCLDKRKVKKYSQNSIVQASDLKETLEEIGLKKEEVDNRFSRCNQYLPFDKTRDD